MKTIISLLALVSLGSSQDLGKFDYRTWKNAEGKEFEARIDSLIEGGKKVILQAKKGGVRYTLPVDKLSPADGAYVLDQVMAQKEALKARGADPVTVYKSSALGLSPEIEKSDIKIMSLKIVDFTTSVDSRSSDIEIEGHIFIRIKIPISYKNKFVRIGDSLCVGSKKNSNDEWWVDLHAGELPQEGIVVTRGQILKFDPSGMHVEWGRVGVVDGPIFSSR